MSGTPSLLIERVGAVGIVTLNRPDVINAFDDTIRKAFPGALAELDGDSGIAAIVLRGAGERGFCVGADINESRAPLSQITQRRRLSQGAWIEAIEQVSKPVIAAIHGFCLGGGMELALACDIRVAARDAKFGLPETALGLIPGGGGTQRLPRLIGLSRALDLLLTGDRIGAEEAYRIGLVTRLEDDREATFAAACALAARIGERPPAATAFVKEAARKGIELDLAAGLNLERSLFTLLTASSDRIEAANAFREKRSGRFTGN